MTGKGLSAEMLTARAGLAPGVVDDLLTGKSWPSPFNCRRIERSLGWETGDLGANSRRVTASAVGATPEQSVDRKVELGIDAGRYGDLSLAELEEAVTAAKLAFLVRVREVRQERAE